MLLQLAQEIEVQDWAEELSLVFCTKIFKPEAAFFKRLQEVWDQEGTLEGVLAQLVEKSEQDRVNGSDIRTLAKKISTLIHDIKANVEKCVEEMEEVRKEMFRVGKNMHTIKETLGGVSRTPRKQREKERQSRQNKFEESQLLGGGRSFKLSQIDLQGPSRIDDESPEPASSPLRSARQTTQE